MNDLDTIPVYFESVGKYLKDKYFDLYIVDAFTSELICEPKNILKVSRADKNELDDFLKNLPLRKAKIIALGAGTVIDVAKYICNKTDSCFEHIPSALSTNSFATHRNSFFDGTFGKVSFDSVVASKIVVDFDLIEKAEILNRFGVIEIAATSTAQIDCTIAAKENNESFDAELLERAGKLVQEALDLLGHEYTAETNRQLLPLLLESGELTRRHGNGRLVSGSEHIISSHIENLFVCPHGMGLLFGILIAYEMQKQLGYMSEETQQITDLLGRNSAMREYIVTNFTPDRIISAALYASPRADKFTAFDMLPVNFYSKKVHECINNYFS